MDSLAIIGHTVFTVSQSIERSVSHWLEILFRQIQICRGGSLEAIAPETATRSEYCYDDRIRARIPCDAGKPCQDS